jgi:hypothetical protein
LGRICKRHSVSTHHQFERLVRRRHHPLREILVMAMSFRVEYHSRWSLSDVDRVRDTEPKPRWYWPLMREAFGLYCSMRRRAVPRSRHAPFLPRGGHVPQVVQDALRARG